MDKESTSEKRLTPQFDLDINLLKNSTKPIVLVYNDKYDKTELAELVALCQKGNPEAMYELGARYYSGVDGVEEDEVRAVKIYGQLLQKQRNARAVRHIGLMLQRGTFGEERKEECLAWLELSSSWGNGNASEDLGLIYSEGELVGQDYDKAIELYLKALNQGNKHAYFNLGDTYRIRVL